MFPIHQPELDHHRIELLVIVLVFLAVLIVVVAVAQMDALFRRSADAKQQVEIELAVLCLHHLDLQRQFRTHQGFDPYAGGGIDKVGLGQHDQIGGQQLVLEQRVQRRFMVQIGVGTALRIHCLRVGGELASGGGGHVDDGDDRVHRARIANLGPVEGLHQRFGQGQSGSLDQDVVDLGPALDELAHHRVELFLHRATQAAVGQFIELPRALAAVFVATDAAAAQNFAIDAELAELIDDDGDTPAVGIGENVA